jgi:hypothetical protein
MAAEPIELSATVAGDASRWAPARRVAFRFVFALALLKLLPFPLDSVPVVGDRINSLWELLPHRVVPWIGHHILHIAREIDTRPNGSGDRTYDYVLLFTVATMAAVIAICWSALARRSTSRPRSAQWLRSYLRLNLAFAMLSYGLAKVFRNQFDGLYLQTFLQPLGAMSPMGLLWRMMDFSPGYTIFTGAVEVLGGVLLIPRRTRTLGALVAAGAMANVVALNFFYDVPVKLYSTQLFLTALWVAGPDLLRLADLLIRNRPTQSPPIDWRPSSRRVRSTLWIMEVAIVGSFLYSNIAQQLQWRRDRAASHVSPLTGLYDLESTVGAANAVTQAIALDRWCKLVFDGDRMMSITHGDEIHTFAVAADEKNRTVTITHDDRDSKSEQKLTFAWNDASLDMRVLTGQGITLRMKRIDPSQTRLMSRGFHWINEYPYNR